jgi:hypothetical protein
MRNKASTGFCPVIFEDFQRLTELLPRWHKYRLGMMSANAALIHFFHTIDGSRKSSIKNDTDRGLKLVFSMAYACFKAQEFVEGSFKDADSELCIKLNEWLRVIDIYKQKFITKLSSIPAVEEAFLDSLCAITSNNMDIFHRAYLAIPGVEVERLNQIIVQKLKKLPN